MFYRRKTYKVLPHNVERFNAFFHQNLLPNQLGHGAVLIGRWVNEEKTEIMAMWEYKDKGQYEWIEAQIGSSDAHITAQEERRRNAEPLFEGSSEEFWTSTGQYHSPRHIVSVSGYILNEKGETLLVRSNHRSDTMELPGGQVEDGETLEEALLREIYEEAGVQVKLSGVTGIYQNVSRDVFCVVIAGEYVSGEPKPNVEETSEAIFLKVNEDNLSELVSCPHFRVRIEDAKKKKYANLESYKVRPYDILSRMKAGEMDPQTEAESSF
ncbi:NUDIX hydrolase [Bacillus sp. 1P06AnD]|uniref:NUDIX hydrolase n=1 Tax=Bacillus sp. 1P06AnD TaxID=3132208 RepID=UPI0039A3E7B0